MFRRPFFALTVGVVLLCLRLPVAVAQDVSEGVDVRTTFAFEGPADCPTDAEAFALIQSHSQKLVRAQRPEDVVAELRIRVSKNAKNHSGVLFVTRPEGSTEQRSVRGASCREVVEALALTAALSVDPEASLFSDTTGSEGATGSEDATNSQAQNQEAGEAANRNPEEKSAEDTGSSPPGKNGKQASSSSLVFALGPELSAEKLLSSGWHMGLGVSFTTRRENSSPLPLELHAGFRLLIEGPFKGSEQITTRLGLFSLGGCPVRWGTTLALLSCLGMDIGWLSVDGQDLEGATNISRLYAAVRLSVPLRYEISQFQFWGAPTLALPVTHREFVVEPGPETISETTTIGFQLALGSRIVF